MLLEADPDFAAVTSELSSSMRRQEGAAASDGVIIDEAPWPPEDSFALSATRGTPGRGMLPPLPPSPSSPDESPSVWEYTTRDADETVADQAGAVVCASDVRTATPPPLRPPSRSPRRGRLSGRRSARSATRSDAVTYANSAVASHIEWGVGCDEISTAELDAALQSFFESVVPSRCPPGAAIRAPSEDEQPPRVDSNEGALSSLRDPPSAPQPPPTHSSETEASDDTFCDALPVVANAAAAPLSPGVSPARRTLEFTSSPLARVPSYAHFVSSALHAARVGASPAGRGRMQSPRVFRTGLPGPRRAARLPQSATFASSRAPPSSHPRPPPSSPLASLSRAPRVDQAASVLIAARASGWHAFSGPATAPGSPQSAALGAPADVRWPTARAAAAAAAARARGTAVAGCSSVPRVARTAPHVAALLSGVSSSDPGHVRRVALVLSPALSPPSPVVFPSPTVGLAASPPV